MRVWDAAGGEELMFDAVRLGRAQLGWIVENGLLVDRLWAELPLSGVRIECPATVEQLEQHADGVRLRLSDGRRLEAGMVIAADGADSAVRSMAGIGVDRHDYGQRGVVAYVDSELPNEATAWQRFLPTGPLAVLPAGSQRNSIVWTLPDERRGDAGAGRAGLQPRADQCLRRPPGRIDPGVQTRGLPAAPAAGRSLS
jgi:2-polyprenyl-6-methoxyphenol hydroxylase and related FAD-dependent oxidoreductases